MTLFTSTSLAKAVEVQKRCYKFLQLVKNDRLALTGGWAISGRHNDAATEAERFKELVLAHFTDLPEDSRPISSKENDLDDFARFFVSYLICSFDLVEDQRLVQTDGAADSRCWCELCARLTDAPNLKLKKVTGRDKGIADSLEAAAIDELAATENVSLSKKNIKAILENPVYAETRALTAYGIELIRRCAGESVDASSLVLWRRFAWDENGRPKKDFVLTAELIEKAENLLISELKELAEP